MKNITKEEAQALSELRKDQSRVPLKADKGVALVVLDRNEYINKAQDLLQDKGTYREIKTDPTNKLKNKLINLLKKIKAGGASVTTCTRRCILRGSGTKILWAT